MSDHRPAPLRGRFPLLTLVAAAMLAGCSAVRPPGAPAASDPLAPAAVQQLGTLLELADRRAYDGAELRSAAAAPDLRVRRQAALTLAALRRPEGLELLPVLLADRDSAVAATAAFAVGQIGDTSAVPLLLPLLEPAAARRRPTVAAEAAYALGKLPSRAARDALRGILHGEVDAAAAEPVGSALLAIWRLPRLTDADPIARWAEAADPELRWRATYALVRRPDPSATALLLRLSVDPDPRVRALAVRGLAAPLVDSAGLPRDQAIAALSRGAADADYATRVSALRSLGSFADPAAVGALQQALRSPRPHDVLAAAEALGRIGPAAHAAAPLLSQLAGSAEAPPSMRAVALSALQAVDPSGAASLARQLAGDPQWRLRAAAARALAGSTTDGERLAALRRDADPRVAAAAVQALVDSGSERPEALRPVLLEALSFGDVGTRAAALAGLQRLRDPATLPALLDAYDRARHDAEADAALAAIDAIAALNSAELDPARAFFARFPRPEQALLRIRAARRFGAAAAAWGEALPVEVRRTPPQYRALAERFLGSPADGVDVVIHTAGGQVGLRLFGADAPLTTQNFLDLARRGYFDGQEWPRVVPNFVVQGGDPRGDTSGGPGYAIRDEINRNRYGTGTVGMALSGPDTGGSQFFLTHSPQPHLDGAYTVFGEVVRGQDVLQRLLPGERISRIQVLP